MRCAQQEWPILAALLETMDALLAGGPGRPAIVLAYKCRSSVLLEDAAFFGPASERFQVECTSLRPYEDVRPDGAATKSKSQDDDCRLALYVLTRGVTVHEQSREQMGPQKRLPPLSPNGESIEMVLSRVGMEHLTGFLEGAAVSELALTALNDRPALLARLRAAGVERLAERQKLANELARSARRRLQEMQMFARS